MTGVSLSKVTLDKRGASVSLEKRDHGFGDVRVNLNWSQGNSPKPVQPTGFFQKLFTPPPARAASIDLDLACLYETMDGRKGAIQALGGNMGSYRNHPFIELSGDDRTGQSQDGETIRINGAQFSSIRRLLFYTFIYDGAPNWDATDGVVTVTVPGERPIEVRLTGGRNDRPLCGICLIENDNGSLKVTQSVDYFRGHQDLDDAHGWHLNWVAGTKD